VLRWRRQPATTKKGEENLRLRAFVQATHPKERKLRIRPEIHGGAILDNPQQAIIRTLARTYLFFYLSDDLL